MKTFKIKIAVQSPLQLGYGKADVIIDSDVVHDKYGMPYFPAKRFKGLLYESALELAEISGEKWFKVSDIKKMFGQGKDGTAQFRISNFYLKKPEEYAEICRDWQYLNNKYRGFFTPQSVLNLYTDIRYQTTIEKKTGTTKEGSLHNMRVIDAGTEFFGELVLFTENDVNLKILILALKNLRFAGAKRNRGCGRISCELLSNMDLEKKIMKEVI